MEVAILGGGAAGFFAAISCKHHHPGAKVTLIEKSNKTLSKVKVSGGGRCNVTNGCESNAEFLKHYPRGQKHLKKTFGQFNRADTVTWFEDRGVQLKTEDDGRMFPVTDDSQTIIDCLRNEVKKLGIKVLTGEAVGSLDQEKNGFYIKFKSGEVRHYQQVIVATGGSPKLSGYDWLRSLQIKIVDPVPSLFTFNIPEEAKLKALMGLSVSEATVKIQGTKMTQSGPLLITHWGLSGPAVLKLSAWGAKELHAMNYDFKIQINWTGELNEEQLREDLNRRIQDSGKKKISNARLADLPGRLWDYLLDRAGLNTSSVWSEVGKKDKNRLINLLVNDHYQVKGKTTFKEEFVTCGGVDLAEVDFHTMESRMHKGLFFAGEVLNIDGVTGGFNFQAAWSTGYVAGKLGE